MRAPRGGRDGAQGALIDPSPLPARTRRAGPKTLFTMGAASARVLFRDSLVRSWDFVLGLAAWAGGYLSSGSLSINDALRRV